ncbi:MAG: hypothetical protein V3V11_09165 [Vicinamibacteria bacterium]
MAERYLLEYEEHLRALNVLPATESPRASREMDTIKEAEADLVRDRLSELGVSLEDGKDGTTWRFK